MKALNIFIMTSFLALSLTGCKEEEVQPFDSDPGINFLAPNGRGGFTDDYTNLKATCNFFDYYLAKHDIDIENADIQLCLQLEGRLSDKPLNIKLKAEPVEGYEMPDLVMPADSILEAGAYRRTFTIGCKRPKEYDKEYKAIISVDYDNSDVVAGTMERQQFELTVTDATDWAMMNVETPEEWNEAYSSVLGQYGPVKVRFMQAALGKLDYTSSRIQNLYYYTQYYPAYGFKRVIEDLKTALQEYNSTHDKPLTEADGTLVTFN